ncbi:hypothetical protein [Chryseobacterium gambrini]|uniref:hypothetical protein n=1 Tax=Chryseobacterium gambrini TaxID=373672 RepID=UPI0022F3C1FC|nr:hypothetical protein [Chryseobacterium gambrini]WBX97899.1 hypothetical protein PE065_01290 [Chryseobacterium gambrini]
MNELTTYYILCQNWDFNLDQWTIFIRVSTIIIGLGGFSIAFIIYFKQRRDAAQDAYDFFINSLPNLDEAVKETINNLQDFVTSLQTGDFANPVIPTSLNNSIIHKINLIDLKRYFANSNDAKIPALEQFLIDSDFFGTYQNYFTGELNFFRQRYLDKEQIYSNWQILRSNIFFSSITDEHEDYAYKKFYSNWVTELNQDTEIFNFDNERRPTSIKSRKLLVDKYIKRLAIEIYPFIEKSEKANQVNLLANQVNSAFLDMDSITSKLIEVFNKDIVKFKEISANIENLY